MDKILHWQSPHNNAEGWLVIDTLVNGVSGGGLFMHPEATKQEVVELAKNMTTKNRLNKIPFGGAKGGIRFDHQSPEARGVLGDFLAFCKPYLMRQWSTGADLNTDSDTIERIINSLGVESSFFALGEMYAQKLQIPNQCHNLRARVSVSMNDYFTLEQGVVGYSIVEMIKCFTNKPLRMVIQGFGKIGSSLAFFTQQQKIASIVAIADVSGALVSDTGLLIDQLLEIKSQEPSCQTLAQLQARYREKSPCQWFPNAGTGDENFLALLRALQVDVISFCAHRYAITSEILDALAQHTFRSSALKLLICGANLPFAHPNLAEEASRNGIAYVPSWLSSAGNSLLYGAALSTQEPDDNWPITVLDRIVAIQIEKIRAVLADRLMQTPSIDK